MRLVTAAEMRAIDRHAIDQVGIPSLVLMENAGLKVLLTLEKVLAGLLNKRFTVVCGKGNNGGDGLVVARHLFNHQIAVHTFIIGQPRDLSPDAATNLKMLENSGYRPTFVSLPEDIDQLRVALEFSDVVVDALYGTGFSGVLEGIPAEAVRVMNLAGCRKVALDVPSGLCADSGRCSGPAFQADLTVTLGMPKLGLYLPPGCDLAGEVWVADIGLPFVSFESVPGRTTLLTQRVAASLMPQRPEHGHKGTFGHLLILAGSDEYQGAGSLVTYGALRSGAGLVTWGMPEGLNARISCEVLPDVIVRNFPSDSGGFDIGEEQVCDLAGVYRAIAAGSGWGRGESRRKTVRSLLRQWAGPLLLDADALNAVESIGELASYGESLVLTPHPGELARLTGQSVQSIREDPLRAAAAFIERVPCVLVLKGPVTIIMKCDGQAFILSRPNSGLARGGSGDLLAGLIGGFLAQGMPPFLAAAVGAWLHAEAGHIARQELGADAMTVTEMASLIPRAFRRLRGEEAAPAAG